MMMMKQAMRTLAGNDLPQQADQDVGTEQDEGGGQPHADAVFQGSGHAQHRTEAEDQSERRNLFPEAFGKFRSDRFGH
jgi:hypothetical protein